MKIRKWIERGTKTLCGVLCCGVAILSGMGIYTQATLPDNLYLAQGNPLQVQSAFPVHVDGTALQLPVEVYSQAGNTFTVDLTTMGKVKVKQVNVEVVERKLLIPGGMPFGIRMFTKGVMVVGMSDIPTEEGVYNPAKAAGIRMGDIITQIDGKAVQFNEDVANLISQTEGKTVRIALERQEQPLELSLKPARSKEDGSYKAGIWVRDSSAGIGTMTFIDPTTNQFGGLGHGICDMDTQQIMPLSSGEISTVTVTGVKKSTGGNPGELKGMFNTTQSIGDLSHNNETGIYGQMPRNAFGGNPIPMAFRQEVTTGPAKILTTIQGNKPKEYDIVIEKVNLNSNTPTKNMIIRVTDPELLDKTGGIVQGMSGSPILQNGTLVGAVTHVFVNEPARGYGIFVENMVESSQEKQP